MKISEIPFDECDVLAFYPFDGEYGNPGDVTLRDYIVKSRTTHVCHICGCSIKPGSIVRSLVEKIDGELMSFYFCTECCVAMEKSWSDDGKSLNKRYAMKEPDTCTP